MGKLSSCVCVAAYVFACVACQQDHASKSVSTTPSDAVLQAAPATPVASAETLASVFIKAVTRDDDKECGELVIRISQGNNVVFNKGYGSVLDGDCHDDDTWHAGETKSFAREDLPAGLVLNGEPIRVVAILFERPGEVNITWDASLEISVVTSANKTLTWVGDRTFNTNDTPTAKVVLDEFDMGRKSFE